MSVYINYKTRDPYFVLGIATNCTNAQDGTEMILYKPMDSDKLCVRDSTEFNVKFSAMGESYEDTMSRQGSNMNIPISILIGTVARLDNSVEIISETHQDALAPPSDWDGPDLLAQFIEEQSSYITELAVAGLFRPLTLKIQRPLASNVDNPGYLTYDEERGLYTMISLDEDTIKWFKGDPKMYVRARLWVDGTLQVVSRVSDLGW